MKCSSVSTSEGRPRALGAGLLLGALLTGCRPSPPPAAARPVTADLGVLVRRHPGWPGVARYDRMLARLDLSVRQARAGADRQVQPLTLPAQTGLVSGEAYTLPPSAVAQERRQLAAQQRAQLARLRRRRTQALQQQLAVQQKLWQSDARTRYAQAVAEAQGQYDQRFSDAFTADSAERLNLTLQIVVLQDTVAERTQAGTPALLKQAQGDLAGKRARLALLETQQAGALADLRRRRDAALARAAADRATSVARQRARLEATLAAGLEDALDTQRALLRRQTDSLMLQERALASAAAPPVGSVGALALPAAAPGPAPAERLEDAEAGLRRQRARWVSFLYDDTRAAAREAARRQGWDVTFGPARRGEPDRTAPLAALLAGRAWKS